MSTPLDSKIIQKFRDSVDQGVFPADMKVVFRIAGGLPSQRIEDELVLSREGKVEVKAQDMLTSKPQVTASAELNQEEVRSAFQKIRSSLDNMVPRSEARFLPDSVIGSVTIEIGDEKETLFFPVEEKERAADKDFASTPLSDTIQYFKETSKRLLENEKGGMK